MTNTFLFICYCIGWILTYFGALAIATFRAKKDRETFGCDPEDVTETFFKGLLMFATGLWPVVIFAGTIIWFSDWLQKKILD